MQFISGAVPLGQEDLKEALQQVGKYESIEDFFSHSLEGMNECYVLSHDQATYFETAAELYALEYTYFTTNIYKDAKRAQIAKAKMFEKLAAAISKDLLILRKLTTLEESEEYFAQDKLLRPLFADPSKPGTIDPKIKDLIERRLHH
jgi:hypothetical protein